MLSRAFFKIPLVDLVVVLAIAVVGWGVFRLSESRTNLAAARQQLEEQTAILRESQNRLRPSMTNAEVALRDFVLAGYDAARVKSEYLRIAKRLQRDLPVLTNAIRTKSRQSEMPPTMQGKLTALESWISDEQDRLSFELLDLQSKDLQERMAEVHRRTTAALAGGATNAMVLSTTLDTLLEHIAAAYADYLDNQKQIVPSAEQRGGASLMNDFREQAGHAQAQLAAYAAQALLDGQAIKQYLASQAHAVVTQKTEAQEAVLRAFTEADSPADFVRRVHKDPVKFGAPRMDLTTEAGSLELVGLVLLGAIILLGVFVTIDLYWRTSVLPLRDKLVRGETLTEHQKKLALLEEMAAGLAHEIRNPLTAISARVFTIQRQLQAGTPGHKDTVVIRSEIERINQTLKSFIQLARPFTPKLEPMTAEPLLKDISELMPPQLQTQGVQLECRPEGLVQFQGDRQQLKQVLVNLVKNAAESMSHDGQAGPAGRIVVRARAAAAPLNGAQGRVAIIEVEDNGPGIPPEVQARLFEPFFSTKQDGTGLGLPISARIIERHGGTLDFQTRPGAGTTFRIALPACEKPE